MALMHSPRKIKRSPRPGRRGVPKGVRTPVTAVKGRCPRPLDDGDQGGDKRIRTADLLHAMQALYQLSYTPAQPFIIALRARRFDGRARGGVSR